MNSIFVLTIFGDILLYRRKNCRFMPKNCRFVRIAPPLPFREHGFSRLPSYPRQRADFVALGYSREVGEHPYDFDNRQRGPGCLFQYGFAGAGCFQPLPDGRPVVLPPGTGFLASLTSNTRYWLPPGGDWEFIYVILSGDLAEDLATRLVEEHGHLWRLPPVHPAIALLRDFHVEACAGRLPDEFTAANLAHRFLMELFRAHAAPRPEIPPPLERARQLLERDFGDPSLDVDRLAAAARQSRFHFSRRFREVFGKSPHVYLRQLRLRRALELLSGGGLPVKQIAAAVGYGSAAQFCREFRRHLGQTPLSVRRLGPRLRLDLQQVFAG